MFSPIVLLCLANFTECVTIGGPVESTRDKCIQAIQEQGIPYLKQKYPDHVVVDYVCHDWGTDA